MTRAISRIVRTRLREQHGFTLVESLAAIALLGITLSGVVAAAGTFHGATRQSHTQQSANALGSDMIEQARALSFQDLKLNSASNPPSSYTDNGTTYTTAGGGIVVSSSACSYCITYSQTITRANVQFTVTQMVLKVASYTDAQSKVQNLKKLIVTVSWTQGKAGSMQLTTIINDQDYLNGPNPTGVHVEVHDAGAAPGDIIDDDNLTWTVTLTNSGGTTVATGTTTEGVYENTSLAAGTYKCTITRSDNTLGYYPKGSTPAGSVASVGCNGGTAPEAYAVVGGEMTSLSSQWSLSNGCANSTTNGTMKLTVKDTDGNPLNNVTIVATPSAVGGTPTTYHTNTSGVASINDDADQYGYTASLAGWSTSSGSFCIYAGATVTATVTLQDAPPAGTLIVKYKNNHDGNGSNYTVTVTGANVGPQQQPITSLDNGKTGQVTYTNIPVDTYTVNVCKIDPVSGNCSTIAVYPQPPSTTGASVTDLHTTTVNLAGP